MFGGIPFEQFAGAHGGSFHGSGMSTPREDVDTTKLYETLGVEKDADAKKIKKAYFKLSKIHHPDKGGDGHKFKEINAAYEILSDPEKRAAYDKYGLEGVSEDGRGGGPGGGADDLFSMFFGGQRGSGRSGPRKGPSVNHPIKVSLEDLYNGKTVKLAVNRKVIVGNVVECTDCRGQGAVLEIRQIGPGMIQQVQRPCDVCNGQGKSFKTKNEREVLEVHIEKGMKHNEKITFRGKADEKPNMEPGDINFVVQEKDHDVFKRKGADLLVIREISLNQALCGYSWNFTHLDGRKMVVKTRPGEVIKPEMNTKETVPFVKTVANEGMPSRGNPFVKGNLFILFRVRFPEDNELSADKISKLREILPDPDMQAEYDAEEVEEHHMDGADLRNFGKGGAEHRGSDAYDSDDENGGGQQVQCAQS
uniref:J domain-containing protein n=1 Tax=Odontella aurita TaxID=265563 RepID=A0A7S4K5T0_9STRA|mmetsp:Transcript_62366/g.184540  ORF Transcript_62366/g.184540 Transcript_62366/m.184540 type:complete len:420 (+) Transcript_62366:198-1457(+)